MRIDYLACIDHRFTSALGILMLSVAENNPKNENVFHIYVEEKEIEVI